MFTTSVEHVHSALSSTCETVFILPLIWSGRDLAIIHSQKIQDLRPRNFAALVQCGREKFHGEFQLDRADPARTANGLTERENTIKQGPNCVLRGYGLGLPWKHDAVLILIKLKYFSPRTVMDRDSQIST